MSNRTSPVAMHFVPDGEPSVLDLNHGNERPLLSGVERFWLNIEQSKEETDIIKEDPCWVYGPSDKYGPSGLVPFIGSQRCPKSKCERVMLHKYNQISQDILERELDFDREVYPLGLSPAAGIIPPKNLP